MDRNGRAERIGFSFCISEGVRNIRRYQPARMRRVIDLFDLHGTDNGSLVRMIGTAGNKERYRDRDPLRITRKR